MLSVLRPFNTFVYGKTIQGPPPLLRMQFSRRIKDNCSYYYRIVILDTTKVTKATTRCNDGLFDLLLLVDKQNAETYFI